jgi:uncharacterized protein
MSGKPAEQDNSIEEILASIRQIIAEDDPKAAEPMSASAAPAEAAPQSEPVANDDVFELVDRVIAEPEPAPVALPPIPEPEPVEEEIQVDLRDMEPEPLPSAPVVLSDDDRQVFSDVAANATLGAFSKLTETILLERQRAISGASVTLEDIVKELLAPLLREWIDKNVPGMVDRLVREELDKLSRQVRER